MRTPDGRFWSKVAKGPRPGGCWFWLGTISDDGYGRFTLNRNGRTRAIGSHRYAYYLATGTWLDEMPQLMHQCDEPICVHAADDASSHLVPGTHRENMLDRLKKMPTERRAGTDKSGPRTRETIQNPTTGTLQNCLDSANAAR